MMADRVIKYLTNFFRCANNRLITNKGGETNLRKTARGFTLVELLVVIAIIAVLAAVVVLIINPLELTRRSRDAARLSDLSNLQQAINVGVQESTSSGSAAILCFNISAPCTESTYPLGASARKSDGTGWVKVNLSTQKSVSVPTLPVDPLNDNDYHYTYKSDGNAWEIDTRLESDQQKAKMDNDGGDCDSSNDTGAPSGVNKGRYEVGSNLTLIAGCS